jgi:hypothetical protein
MEEVIKEVIEVQSLDSAVTITLQNLTCKAIYNITIPQITMTTINTIILTQYSM